MSSVQRISLNTIDAIHLVQVQDILYCKCDNSSTTFYLTNHEPIMVSRSIKEIEKQLSESNFLRSHQSYLVNISHIVEVNKTNNYSIILSDNSRIPTSIRKRKEITQILLDK
ncbi:MAG: LytTR family transcriptional regulator DNA-binding domain-containing protein [Draconibacterium sp.]|nr:LytTR family transcriptional regulator DNA-binding domain-containing protein [Draconibacterium sp.]